MTEHENAIYEGSVMHRRLRPARHSFRYHVFSLLADLDSIETIAAGLRLFSVNRRNVIALHFGDHGNGGNLRDHLDRLSAETVGCGIVKRYLMLCYPRVFGFVFNPLTVYYGLDDANRVAVIHYEVNNTFGGRHTYAIANPDLRDSARQSADKEFYVSPFNTVSGRYVFRTRRPSDKTSLSILLEDETGPIFSAGFTGVRRPLSDRELLRQIARNGLMTFKVWIGIRWEALRLWRKGLEIQPRSGAPRTHGAATGFRSLLSANLKPLSFFQNKSADQPEI